MSYTQERSKFYSVYLDSDGSDIIQTSEGVVRIDIRGDGTAYICTYAANKDEANAIAGEVYRKLYEKQNGK